MYHIPNFTRNSVGRYDNKRSLKYLQYKVRANLDFAHILAQYKNISEDTELLIGLELKKLRKQAGLTQSAVGQKLFRSASTISSLENGCIFRNFNIFMEVCEFYNILPGLTIYQAELASMRYYFEAKVTF